MGYPWIWETILQKDKRYAVEIANALKAKDNNGQLVVDEVVVLIDGSNRDMKNCV